MKAEHVGAFERARQEVIRDADRGAPRLQGRLAASITTDGPARRTPAGVQGAFGSAERHAAMREFGGFIAPVRKKALSWISPTTGARIVLGPGIRRKFAKVDKATGQVVIFVPGAGVQQKPGGPRQGYRPYLRPAADRFSQYMADHLRALGR
jgi:hypothetical protein